MATDHAKNRKVAIVGLETITSAEIYSLLVSGRIETVVLVGVEAPRLIREVKEIQDLIPLGAGSTVVEGRLGDCVDAQVVIVTGPTQLRNITLEGLQAVVKAVKRSTRDLNAIGFSGVLLVTGVPVEILVKAASEGCSLAEQKIVGIGNRSDLRGIANRLLGRENADGAEELQHCNPLPLGWCTAAGADVSYVDSCRAECPFFEALIASPTVAKPYIEGGDRPRSPQMLAACVTQVCEAVVDDLGAAMPVFIRKAGSISSCTSIITRAGATEVLPPGLETDQDISLTEVDRLWAMINEKVPQKVSRKNQVTTLQ